MNERLRKIFKQLNDKYRLVIMNDITLEERLSLRLSRMNVFVVFSTIGVILVALTVAFIVYTPLKEYIPGYQDVTQRRRLLDLTSRTDSLGSVVNSQNNFIRGLQKVLMGEVDSVKNDFGQVSISQKGDYSNINLNEISPEDSMLRKELEDEGVYELFNEDRRADAELSDLYFAKPLEGYVTDSFNVAKEHYGIDLIGEKDAPVKAILDGVIIMNDWSYDTGYVVGIQHSYNLVSFYKHNSVILKKVGTLVTAGDIIAIVGDTGELSDGKHLHLELWHNQSPVDPLKFIIY